MAWDDTKTTEDNLTAAEYNAMVTDQKSRVTLTGTETLTNKRLTSPKLNENVAITATATEVNTLDGLTSTTAELNILDGVTATTAELNILDGVTSTAAELNKLDGFTGAVADLNYAAALNATGVTSTEYDYLDGVTSAIQTQLNTKQGVLSEGAFVDGDKTKLNGIATGAEVNTIDSDPTSDGVTGSDQITNIVSCTQAEYDAGTPVSTIIYIITD